MAPKKTTLNTIKRKIAEQLSKAKALITLIERLLSSERSSSIISVLDGYYDKLSDQLLLLEELPSIAEEFIQANKGPNGTYVLGNNKNEVKEQLNNLDYETTKDQLITLMGEINMAVKTHKPISESPTSSSNRSEDRSSRMCSLEKKSELSVQKMKMKQPVPYAKEEVETSSITASGPPSSSGTHSSPLNSGLFLSNQQLKELEVLMGHRLKSIEETQKLLFEQYDNAKKMLQNLESQKSIETPVCGANENLNLEKVPNRGAYGSTCHQTEQQSSGQLEKARNPIMAQDRWKYTSFGSSTSRPVYSNATPTPEHPVQLNGNYSMAHDEIVKTNPNNADIRNSTNSHLEISSPSLASNVINSITSTIQPFDGNPDEYPLFKQMFDFLIHENDQIPVQMKHGLLMKLLEGEVRSMMRTPQISAEGYHTLRQNLDRQYNRENDTTQALIEQLQRFSFAVNDFVAMEKDLNKYCVIVNTLRNKGCQVDDAIFLDSFVAKLPEKIMAPVFKKNRERRRNFDELVEIACETVAEKKAVRNAREKKKRMVPPSEVYALQGTERRSNNKQFFRDEEDQSSGSQ